VIECVFVDVCMVVRLYVYHLVFFMQAYMCAIAEGSPPANQLSSLLPPL